MEILRSAMAGTLESSDILVTLEPGESGIDIQLDSAVEKQFGGHIRALLADTLRELGVARARVTAVDRGALDFAIRARVKAAALRACAAEEGGR